MSVVPANGGGLLNRQWWRVCLVHGDQTKYYRQLYGGHKRAAIRTQLHNDAKKITSAVDAASSSLWPKRASTTGRKTRPWKRPNTTDRNTICERRLYYSKLY